jgi:hypothetical protein
MIPLEWMKKCGRFYLRAQMITLPWTPHRADRRIRSFQATRLAETYWGCSWQLQPRPKGAQSPNRLLRIGIKAVRGKTKPLTKLRPKPQVSAAFRCSSIGINAYCIDPRKRPPSRLHGGCSGRLPTSHPRYSAVKNADCADPENQSWSRRNAANPPAKALRHLSRPRDSFYHISQCLYRYTRSGRFTVFQSILDRYLKVIIRGHTPGSP